MNKKNFYLKDGVYTGNGTIHVCALPNGGENLGEPPLALQCLDVESILSQGDGWLGANRRQPTLKLDKAVSLVRRNSQFRQQLRLGAQRKRVYLHLEGKKVQNKD